jgi:methylmalonyl-CoA mutase
MKPPEPGRPLRFVSAASLFDGHDAAINMIRRLLQSGGAEVVHLGHNRSVADIVRAAIAEDADAIAVSSYQGGHNEYFRYMIDMLREQGAQHIKVVVGGGGTISPAEISALEAYGIARIYTPEDGRQLGLKGMIDDVFARVARTEEKSKPGIPALDDAGAIARAITLLEGGGAPDGVEADDLRRAITAGVSGTRQAPVIGLTGTGGAGKSSLNDELLQRFLRQFPDRRIAVVAIDPTRRRSGGALLGDRIRMNSLAAPQVFMRSLATRRQHLATSAVLADVIALYRAVGFDLIVVETAGIGQSDTEIVDLADLSLYVMTAEYGAASQLEKIDMLDFADMIVLNKFEKRGAEDALRDVRKQWRRNHPDQAKLPDADIPVFPTIASRFNDPGVNRLFLALARALDRECGVAGQWTTRAGAPLQVEPTEFRSRDPLIPAARSRYLAEIATQGRAARAGAGTRAQAAQRAQGLYLALESLGDANLPAPLAPAPEATGDAFDALRANYNRALAEIGAPGVAALRNWEQRIAGITAPEYSYAVRGREVRGENFTESLSHNPIPKLAPPRLEAWGERLRFIEAENLPGAFRTPARCTRTGARKKTPRACSRAKAGPSAPIGASTIWPRGTRRRDSRRPSTPPRYMARTPTMRPDIFGRTGNSGVSIATLDDMKKLYSGFDLCAPTTLRVHDHQRPGADDPGHVHEQPPSTSASSGSCAPPGRWEEVEAALARAGSRPNYRGELPAGHDGSGLGLLGVSGRKLVELGLQPAAEYAQLRAEALARVRGTVQADILKEDQAQNTCIFSTEFALRMMGDVQQFFSENGVRNFYSVSISGTTSPRPARTRSRSWRSRWPTASPSSSTTWRAA